LEDVSAIDIVADDFLQRVPFGALFDRRSRTFLVQHYAIATSPSAGVFLATLARERRLPSRRPNALVFANPTIPREQYGDLPSLSASQYEAPRIARRYARAEVFTGDDATAERFRELAPSHDVVHFAGHGVINEREPYSSALVCAATPQRSGGVTSHDIARMKFRFTRVVVLAACSTLTGRNAAVEGVPSLARAFVVAGVPAVVGTLWDIEDSEAVAITRPLHEQLARGAAPADALRDAQLAAIRKNLPPSQWSAFALMGSASALPVPARTHAELAAK
jgi:CHAT domain-containing protein